MANTLIKLNDNSKALIIGDIHGCYDELVELIRISGIEPGKDYIISLGDIVDRGPSTDLVIRFFQNTNKAYVILGNHEIKHLRKDGFDPDDPSGNIQRMILNEFENSNMISFIKHLPLFMFVETENKNYLLVHAGLTSQINLNELSPFTDKFENIDEKIKIITGIGSQGRKGFDQKSIPWYEEIGIGYTVLYGHLISKEVIHGTRNNVFGLDTGCSEGGKLSGIVLPDERIVEVKAKENYYFEMRKKYLDQLYLQHYDEIPWQKRLALLDYEILTNTKEKIRNDLEHLKSIRDKISQIAEKIRFVLDFKNNISKEILGKNWSKFMPDYPNLSAEIKKALFKPYEDRNLFGMPDELRNQLETEIENYNINFVNELNEIRKKYNLILCS